MRRPPTDLADAISPDLGFDTALMRINEFLDAFYGAPDHVRQAMISREPSHHGDERLDAYVGAVAEHLARRWGLTIPSWATADERACKEPWFVGELGTTQLASLYLAESPIAFRRRRIFTEAEPLRRARMPVATT
jgi:hypothetical protein